jgi:hypothetical protein
MMKQLHFLIVLLSCFLIGQNSFAQGFGNPLTMQALDHVTNNSVTSRAQGGITVGINNEISLMFANPASLQSLQGIQVSLGGYRQISDMKQDQQYSPLKYYSNFSLLLEGLTGFISNPDTNKFYLRLNTTTNAYDTVYYVKTSIAGGSGHGEDTVQRPYDKIQPNWSRSKSKNYPAQVFFAAPIALEKFKLVVGAGVTEYANLNWYFKNNNVLSPNILSVKNGTVTLPVNTDNVGIPVSWYQYYQQRDGSIKGYGGAVSLGYLDKVAFGVSAVILKGNTDDFESRVERGKIVFFSNSFRLDSNYYHVTQTGTSNYSGTEFTYSGNYRSKFIEVGFSVKPPTIITRKYTTRIQIDTIGASTATTVSSQDKMTLPWRGIVGLSIALRDNVTFGFGYELRSYTSAQYKISTGIVTNPWLTSHELHFGVEFRPVQWLSMRAGAREQSEAYESYGNPLAGEPVNYTVLTGGLGFNYSNLHVNVAYEYSNMKYNDMWASCVSLNSEVLQNISLDASYTIPW